jgi:hypothetical protein
MEVLAGGRTAEGHQSLQVSRVGDKALLLVEG